MGKPAEQSETPQQRAMAQHATNMFADYQQRWLPVQQKLASQIEAMGKPGSAARNLAAGKASTDTAIQFGRAQGALEKGLSNTGALPGSARATAAEAGMGADRAAATGLGGVIADQQIDQAYTQGLSSLMAMGRGERASVGGELADQAAQSARQSQADAQASLQGRMGEAGMVGTLGGFGLQQWAKGMQGNNGAGGAVGRSINPGGMRINNPSAFDPGG
jgi:hypothetical protein